MPTNITATELLPDVRIRSGAVINRRPLFMLALGLILGISLAPLFHGICRTVCICLFLIPSVILYRRRIGISLLLFACSLGILRVMLFESVPVSDLVIKFTSDVSDFFNGIRSSLVTRTQALFNENGALINGMLWGYKNELSASDIQAFRSAGFSHILALSGLHVSFFTGALMFVLPKRFPRLRFFVVAAFLAVYCAIAAFPPSLVRASIMALCITLAYATNRRPDTLSSMSLALIIIILFSPDRLSSIGLQLSFAAVGSICLFYRPLKKALHKLGDVVSASVAVSVCGWAGTVPLCALYFSEFAWISVLTNTLALPLMSAGILISFISIIIDIISPVLSYVPAVLGGFAVGSSAGAVRAIASIKYCSLHIPAPSQVIVACIYISAFILSRFVLCEKRKKFFTAGCVMLFAVLHAVVGYFISHA